MWHSTTSLSFTVAEASNFYTDGDMTQGTWDALQGQHKSLQDRAMTSAKQFDGSGHKMLIHIQLLSTKPFRQKSTSSDYQQIHGPMCVASAQCFAACSLPHTPQRSHQLASTAEPATRTQWPYIYQNMQVVSNMESSASSNYSLAITCNMTQQSRCTLDKGTIVG